MQGFGYHALHLMKEYAFRFLLLKQLYAYVPKTNLASYQLFIKSGYVENGFLESWIKTAEGFMDVFFMQLIKSDS
jgi:diamine N-acetyltransferase